MRNEVGPGAVGRRRRARGSWLSPAVALAAAMVLLSLGSASGCDDVSTERPVECGVLCERYEECVEPIDVSACVVTCEQRASVSRLYGLAAVVCQDCVAGRSCDEAAACWDTCPVRRAD